MADSGPSRRRGWILRVRVIPRKGLDRSGIRFGSDSFGSDSFGSDSFRQLIFYYQREWVHFSRASRTLRGP